MYSPCIVIGGGVVGLACARAVSISGVPTLLLESRHSIGEETSSRNSEVLHSGIYYAQHSLKAQLCLRGQRLLKEYIQSRGIGHNHCGKFIVATSSQQVPKLLDLAKAGHRNGVQGLELVDSKYLHDMGEFEVAPSVVKALWSPNTSIFDSHHYMQHLLADAEASLARTDIVFDCRVDRVDRLDITSYHADSRFLVYTNQGNVECRMLINASGLHSTYLARRITGFDPRYIPGAYFAKGTYFKLQRSENPFQHLIYPLPIHGGLGVHSTIDMSGQVRFGPDAQWLRKHGSESGGECDPYDFSSEEGPPIDYTVDNGRSQSFYEAIRTYWPGLPDDSLIADYAGIRPKLMGPQQSDAANDFAISGPAIHGVAGLVNLFGIESPGLTASLAIAEHVSKIVISDR